MALFLDGPVPLEDTIAFTQQVPLPSNNRFTNMFPTRMYDTDEIDFATITQTNRTAKFRNWDGSFWVAPRDTGSEKRVRMLPLGGQLSVGEYERRQKEMARYGGTIQNILVDAIYDDLTNLTRYAQNRVELAWGDVLTDGVLTINENGVQQQVDYGIDSSQKVTASTLWSNHAASTPLTDLIAWTGVYSAVNGAPQGQFVTSSAVVQHLMQNTQLINAIKGDQTGVTWLSINEINGFLSGFGIPPFVVPTDGQPGGSVYNSSFDVDGSTVPVIATNKLLFLPSDLSTLGFTAWGTPTTSLELNANNVQVETAAGLIGILVREEQPPFRKTTFVDGVVLPVLADPRKILIATVA
ncbi:Phage major capsid protein E [Mycolicibacterium neoaurum]|uniref:major capsid protein n=1 Tax=Mycolicibacterium neoaurum TaxID=1795 RepID=UPI000561F079|nr:major capsid protein [Mycolicibacterium neoaurum]SDD59026.1 Phage major capsid protein E [Mycolicibacterium neoaurum]